MKNDNLDHENAPVKHTVTPDELRQRPRGHLPAWPSMPGVCQAGLRVLRRVDTFETHLD